MREKIKSFLAGINDNFSGQNRINKRIVIIESDDWGAIRTPSKEALVAFEKRGFDLSKSLYKVDALASKSDLEELFNLLTSVKNQYGKHPVITANAIMANPDFDKIQESDFKDYFFEPFYETFKRYPEHENNLNLWKEGMSLGVFQPQFHGREHLNVERWLAALQSGDEHVRFTFNWRSTYSGKADYAFMEAFDWNDPSQIEKQEFIVRDGMNLFRDTFGFNSKSFIAPCYRWDPKLDEFLSSEGIELIQGIKFQKVPLGGNRKKYKSIRRYFAQENEYGMKYNIRNVFFEPVNNPNEDFSDKAMARINAAFLMRRPAVISTHRLNYIGFIDQSNRDNGLTQLKKLLQKIVKKWPDVHFISSDELLSYLKQ